MTRVAVGLMMVRLLAGCGDSAREPGKAAPAVSPGKPCNAGESKPASDGCNTCTCRESKWVCTELACPSGKP